jgi:SWIM/SEC-C metal-binding protein
MKRLGSRQNPAIVRVRTEDEARRVVELCEQRGWQVIVGVEPDEEEDFADLVRLEHSPAPVRGAASVGRNDPCRCGSGRKYKRCCLARDTAPGEMRLDVEVGTYGSPAGYLPSIAFRQPLASGEARYELVLVDPEHPFDEEDDAAAHATTVLDATWGPHAPSRSLEERARALAELGYVSVEDFRIASPR